MHADSVVIILNERHFLLRLIFIISMLDNLLKGASGQAVQNMNLMFDLDERAGLQLKANAF